MMRLCEVAVPVPLRKIFHYAIPTNLEKDIAIGKRLSVPFGPRKLIAYCVGLDPITSLDVDRIKPIYEVLDESPLLSPALLKLTRWISDHYLCPWTDVLQAALPAPTRQGKASAQLTFVELRNYPSEEERQTLSKKSPKQALLIELLHESAGPLKQADLLKLARASASSLKSLAKKEYITFTQEDMLEDPLQKIEVEKESIPTLQEDQQKVWDKYLEHQHGTFLLHGVTGSGKTEIYLRAIEKALNENKQTLVLVPEISLTPQTLRRFRARFERLAVLHSNLTPAQRAKQWSRIVAGEADVIIGARSALFSPTQRLGLIIVDEEHDGSFKQQNSPRYNARDVAIMRGIFEKVPVILGSATPQIESWYNAQQKKSILLSLPRRISNLPLPPISLLDMSEEIPDEGKNQGQVPLFSRKSLVQLEQCVSQGGQAIMLLNRRGFSPVLSCKRCANVPRCPNCDISLTYHKKLNRMICHYCHHHDSFPQECSKCHFNQFQSMGAGTEKIESVLSSLMPTLRLLRMDADSTRARGSHQKILDQFRRGEADVLLGTQMIAKGHDFPNVDLVIVLNADVGLTLPDFRAAEKTFSLLTQVAGRAGRKNDNGRVLVQTMLPRHYAIECASRHDIEGFIQQELAFRKPFLYPPYGRLARVMIQGKNENHVLHIAKECRKRLNNSKNILILGPAPCPLSRIDEKFRIHLLLKAPTHKPLHQSLMPLMESPPHQSDTKVVLDIDPLSLL